MYELNTIIINHIANGWVVVLPQQMPQMYMPDEEEKIRSQARIMKDEFMKDDVLARIEKEHKEQEEIPARERTVIVKNENTYCFKTWREVIEFLSTKIDGAG